MDITRRKFFFFGLAAGIGLFLPENKILPLHWDLTRIDVISEIDILNMEMNKMLPKIKDLFEHDDLFFKMIRNKKKVEYISLP